MAAVIVVWLEHQSLAVGANKIQQVHFTSKVVGMFISHDARPRHVSANGSEFFFRKECGMLRFVSTANSAFL
jgi:hypothetical protein